MIDLHTHILFGADDGAESEDMTRRMFELCREQQIRIVAATSHYEQCDNESYARRFGEVSRIAGEYGITLLPGAEYLYGDLLDAPAEKLRPIAGKNYLLLDLRRVYPDTSVCRNLYKITSRGFRILLAHPERLWGKSECLDIVRRLTENPLIVCQLNAESILGFNGGTPRLCAWKLMEAGLCALIASDAHSADKTVMAKCCEKLQRIYPEETVLRWFDRNPKRIIDGDAVIAPCPDPAFAAKLRRAWKFWL